MTTEKERHNQRPGVCWKCKAQVAAGAGFLHLAPGRKYWHDGNPYRTAAFWVVECAECHPGLLAAGAEYDATHGRDSWVR